MLTPYHTTNNRTATTNGPISLAYAAGLGKYGYGNGIVVTERISGTVLYTYSFTYGLYLIRYLIWFLIRSEIELTIFNFCATPHTNLDGYT